MRQPGVTHWIVNNVGARGFIYTVLKILLPEISHHFSLSGTKNPFHLNIQIIVVKENAFLLFPPPHPPTKMSNLH